METACIPRSRAMAQPASTTSARVAVRAGDGELTCCSGVQEADGAQRRGVDGGEPAELGSNPTCRDASGRGVRVAAKGLHVSGARGRVPRRYPVEAFFGD